jgi:hypothetical protein
MLQLAVPILVVFHVTARLSKVYLYLPYHAFVKSTKHYLYNGRCISRLADERVDMKRKSHQPSTDQDEIHAASDLEAATLLHSNATEWNVCLYSIEKLDGWRTLRKMLVLTREHFVSEADIARLTAELSEPIYSMEIQIREARLRYLNRIWQLHVFPAVRVTSAIVNTFSGFSHFSGFYKSFIFWKIYLHLRSLAFALYGLFFTFVFIIVIIVITVIFIFICII